MPENRPTSKDPTPSDRSVVGSQLTDSSATNLLARAKYEFSMDQFDAAELRKAIYSVQLAESESEPTRIRIKASSQFPVSAGYDNALMRINRPVDIQVDGSLGNYAFALSSEAVLQCHGHVGHGVAEGLAGATVKVRGNAGDGAGAAMTGGTLAIYGSAGHRCGGAMRGGGVFVRGNVGDHCGIGALGGVMVIGGDAGECLGDAMDHATIFIRGRIGSLAPGVTEAPLSKKETLRLGLLLINASIRGEAKQFRRLVARSTFESELARRGEINPSWR